MSGMRLLIKAHGRALLAGSAIAWVGAIVLAEALAASSVGAAFANPGLPLALPPEAVGRWALLVLFHPGAVFLLAVAGVWAAFAEMRAGMDRELLVRGWGLGRWILERTGWVLVAASAGTALLVLVVETASSLSSGLAWPLAGLAALGAAACVWAWSWFWYVLGACAAFAARSLLGGTAAAVAMALLVSSGRPWLPGEIIARAVTWSVASFQGRGLLQAMVRWPVPWRANPGEIPVSALLSALLLLIAYLAGTCGYGRHAQPAHM